MANNEYVNKVEFGNETIIDISNTTAEAGDVLEGEIFYTRSGAPATGTLGDATTSSHGLMSAADKTKLDGIEEGAQADTVILTYGVSTWNDFITAYNANKAIFCKVQVGGNVTQTRLVPLCFVDTGEQVSGRKAEFQYYRSRNDGTSSITYNDELYLYILRYTNSVWETSVRLVTTETVNIPNATTTTAGLMSTSDKLKLNGIETGAQVNPTVMVGATSVAAGTGGLVPAPALGDANKYLKGDGTWGAISGSGSSGGASEIAIFNYGSATWAEFLEAYNAGKIIFCQANGTTSQETRIAPIIYHNLNKVEFQYYRSADITGASLIKYDEVYIYTLYSDNTWETIVRPIRNQIMTGATSSTNGTSGAVPVPTSADIDKFLAGDGTYKSGGLPMVILSYGSSTWNDFINAYNNNVIVYCRASSNANPASGSQTRMAFMAYVNNAYSPTEVEFQYYRSVSSHTSSQMGDQVFVYKLNSSGTWSVTTREASLKQIKIGTGDAASVSYSSNVITLKGGLPAVTASDNGKILQVVNGVWTAVTPS